MAIDPTTVNILNINELQTATSVQENDLLVIGQGIYARKTTVLALYDKFGIQSLVDDVMTLQGDIADLGLINAVQFSPQILTVPEQDQARDNIAALGTADLDGFVYDVTYNNANHQITFYSQNEPNIVIDLPIEELIKNVQLVGDDLVFTFEDGSTVTVPLNTLLVGVVKSVNGLTPNSQGEIILNITDIPGLSSELAAKANQNGNYPNMTAGNSTLWNSQNYVNTLNNGNFESFMAYDPYTLGGWRPTSISAVKSKLGYLTAETDPIFTASAAYSITNADIINWNGKTSNLGTVTSVSMSTPTGLTVAGSPITNSGTLALSYSTGYQGYTTTEANKLAGIAVGAEVNVNADWNAISGDAQILNKPTTFPPSAHTHPISDIVNLQTELAAKANTTGNYPNMTVGNADEWNGKRYTDTEPANFDKLMVYDPFVTDSWRPVSVSPVKDKLGITDLENNKVDKIAGKQLSTEDYTSAEKTKLGNIQDGAEVNVQADWNQANNTADDFIKNKPTIPTNNNQLTNGAGYITTAALSGYALTSQIPTNNNQLTNGAGYITETALTGYATQSYVTSQGYQNASQVSAEITNQISALGLAPEGFEFFHAAPTIDTDRYREVIANYSGSSVVNIDVTNPQYNGVVLTVQAGDNQLNLTIQCLLGNVMRTDDEVLPGMATTYVFNDSLGVWVRRSMNKEF